jgi:hypothetical protein
MALSNHQYRVSKLRARIVTVDPANSRIDAITGDGTLYQLAMYDVPSGFVWPKEDESWSIYEENGYWRLGHRFLNDDERQSIQDLAPGERYYSGEEQQQLVDLIDSRVTAGSSDKHYTHTQTLPSATWNINHDLGKFPTPKVYDSAGSGPFEGNEEHIDLNNMTITFSAAFAGVAYLN